MIDKRIPKKLYHYTSINTLAFILKSRSIRLVSLNCVDDISEAKSNDNVQFGQYIFVTCWTDLQEESIPFWNMYTPNMAGVRIGFNTPIFEGYSFEGINTKGIQITGAEQNQSILPFEKFHGNGYIVSPGKPEDFLKVTYTNDPALLQPTCFAQDTTNHQKIVLSKLGAHKKQEWEFQSEWRYRLIIFPCIGPPSENYNEKRYQDQWLSSLKQIMYGQSLPFNDFFLQIDMEIFKTMEVLIGPKHNEGDVAIIESLLKNYNPNAILKISSLKGTIR